MTHGAVLTANHMHWNCIIKSCFSSEDRGMFGTAPSRPVSVLFERRSRLCALQRSTLGLRSCMSLGPTAWTMARGQRSTSSSMQQAKIQPQFSTTSSCKITGWVGMGGERQETGTCMLVCCLFVSFFLVCRDGFVSMRAWRAYLSFFYAARYNQGTTMISTPSEQTKSKITTTQVTLSFEFQSCDMIHVQNMSKPEKRVVLDNVVFFFFFLTTSLLLS